MTTGSSLHTKSQRNGGGAVIERAQTAIFDSSPHSGKEKEHDSSNVHSRPAKRVVLISKQCFIHLLKAGKFKDQPTRDGKESYFIINNVDVYNCEFLSSDVFCADILNSSLSVNNQPPSTNKQNSEINITIRFYVLWIKLKHQPKSCHISYHLIWPYFVIMISKI